MLRARLFRADRPPEDTALDAWPAVAGDPEALLWADLHAPTDEELGALRAVLGVDPRALEHIRRPSRRPAVRVFGGHYVVTALALDLDEGEGAAPRIRVAEFDVLVGPGVVATVHSRVLPFAAAVEERTAANPHIGALDAAYLLYVLLDALLDHFTEELEALETRLDRLEDRLLVDPSRGALREATVMKRHVQTVRRFVAPHGPALAALVAPDSPVAARDDLDTAAFRDLVARFDGLLRRLDHARDMALAAYTLYTSGMSYRTNQQLKVLTFLSAVLLPMTVVTGLFGTNFRLAEYDHWEPFYLMLAGLVLLTGAMLAYFRSRRWL